MGRDLMGWLAASHHGGCRCLTFATPIEPVMVVVLGVIVGFIVVALFMPMISLIEGISNSNSKGGK